MVYVYPATVTATSCDVPYFTNVAVDVELAVGWNRVRLSRAEGTLLDGHDPDAIWIWD